MLAPLQPDRVDAILVRPRNPLNIGAAARAMANFGFTHLTVVAPYEPHWRDARSAVGAPELLQSAKEAESLAQAVSNCTFVAGTATLAHRKPDQPVILLPQLAPLLAAKLETAGRAALVFGPEKHGLTRDDLSYCHVLVQIPTDARQPSMNLGQAVAVCLYELARCAQSPAADQPIPESQSSIAPAPSASSGALDRLASIIEETMIASGYSPAAMRRANRLDLRLLLRRMSVTESDAHGVLRLFRRILWRIRRP